jgi:hypothetical protein
VVCTTEVVVVKCADGDFDLRCGGTPMVVHDNPTDVQESPAAGYDGGSAIGKRYVDGGERIELLCTKPGSGTLALGEEVLTTKRAKALPSSD